jgi:hypothetical protein
MDEWTKGPNGGHRADASVTFWALRYSLVVTVVVVVAVVTVVSRSSRNMSWSRVGLLLGIRVVAAVVVRGMFF